MTHALRETLRSLRASPIFAFYVVATFGLAGFIGLMFGQMAWQLDVFLPGGFGRMQHGAAESHRIHDFTFGFLITTGIVGVLAQLQRPANNVAGMVMALVPFVGLALAAVFSDADVIERNPLYLVAAVTAVAALLHPTGRAFFRSFNVAGINWAMLALVGVAAVPLLAFTIDNIELQETVADDHAGLGHYAFMAAFGFTVIGVGLLASLRPDGWRLAAWAAGLLPALVGGLSVIYPDLNSSLGLGWGVAAIAWGVAFVATAELTKSVKSRKLLGSWGEMPNAERG